MQDIWYGDRRDRVKWAALAWLATEHGAKAICQVAYYRRFGDTKKGTGYPRCLRVGKASEVVEIPPAVWEFFDITHAEDLGKHLGVTVRVFNTPFTPKDRLGYTDLVRKEIEGTELDRPMILFLDPDTGIAPESGAKREHVTSAELTFYWEAVLHADEWLAVYQHAPRKKDKGTGIDDWSRPAREIFEKACEGAKVTILSSEPVAEDVALLAARKPS